MIYELELHEVCEAVGYSVMRVPGGWIYHWYTSDSVVFVPYDGEFKEDYYGDEEQ